MTLWIDTEITDTFFLFSAENRRILYLLRRNVIALHALQKHVYEVVGSLLMYVPDEEQQFVRNNVFFRFVYTVILITFPHLLLLSLLLTLYWYGILGVIAAVSWLSNFASAVPTLLVLQLTFTCFLTSSWHTLLFSVCSSYIQLKGIKRYPLLYITFIYFWLIFDVFCFLVPLIHSL